MYRVGNLGEGFEFLGGWEVFLKTLELERGVDHEGMRYYSRRKRKGKRIHEKAFFEQWTKQVPHFDRYSGSYFFLALLILYRQRQHIPEIIHTEIFICFGFSAWNGPPWLVHEHPIFPGDGYASIGLVHFGDPRQTYKRYLQAYEKLPRILERERRKGAIPPEIRFVGGVTAFVSRRLPNNIPLVRTPTPLLSRLAATCYTTYVSPNWVAPPKNFIRPPLEIFMAAFLRTQAFMGHIDTIIEQSHSSENRSFFGC